MKEDFDMCEAATECSSGRCTNGRCTSNEIQVSSQLSLNVMIVLVFLMLIIVVTTCYFAKIKADQAENLSSYRRSRHNRDQSSDTDRSGVRGDRHRPSRRHSRNEQRRSGNSPSSDDRRRRGTDNSPNFNRDDDFQASPSRGLSDNMKHERLSRENLERLPGKQAQTDSNRGATGAPALLFVEDHDILNRFGSSHVTGGTGKAGSSEHKNSTNRE